MIQITPKVFEQLYTRRYIRLNTGAKGKATIKLHPIEGFNAETEQLLFISDVKTIEVAANFDTQMVKSLYGIPAGLFETTGSSQKRKTSTRAKNKAVATDSEPDADEQYYIRLRAALLYATVWFEKNFGSKAMVALSQQLLSASVFTAPPVKALLQSLSQYTDFPERTPSNVTLDTTRYDNNWNWLGVHLAHSCFAPGNKMDTPHKDWFLQLVKTINQRQPAPEKFRTLEPFIRGYLTVIAARQKNQTDVNDVFNMAKHFSADIALQHQHTFLALLFTGLFDAQAHCYFLTAGGLPMMRFLERLAFAAAIEPTLLPDSLKQEAHEGLLHLEDSPLQNCINYYRFKNNAIAHRDWFEYTGGLGGEYPDKTALLSESEASVFLLETGRYVEPYKLVENSVLLTVSWDAYAQLAQAGLHTVCPSGHSLYASFNGLIAAPDNHNPFVALDAEVSVPQLFANHKNLKPRSLDTLFPKNSKAWILFTNEGIVPGWLALLLQALLRTRQPEVILAINFTLNGKVPAQNKLLMTNADAEAQTIHQLAPNITIREVRQMIESPIWETVALATGVLAHYDFHQMMVLDTRAELNPAQTANILFRCTRDVILYDANQKYITMNINRI